MLKIIVFIFLLPLNVFAQLHREPVFGLDRQVYDWGQKADVENFGAEPYKRIRSVTDIANLRIANGADTTDIILISDIPYGGIFWVRTPANRYPRPVLHIGGLGPVGRDSSIFFYPMAIEVASDDDLYDPEIDHIYVADEMNHRIAKLNFSFDPTTPENDSLIFESSITLDDRFSPRDIVYINLRTGSLRDNRLVALDYAEQRLVVMNHDGEILRSISLVNPLDTIPRYIMSFTWKLNSDRTISVYMVDILNSAVLLYRLSRNGIEFQNELRIGQPDEYYLGNIFWHPTLGLWQLEGSGPHFYKLAEDLSSILTEINEPYLNPTLVPEPVRLVALPERLAIIQYNNNDRGIISYSFTEPFPRPYIPAPIPLPHKFALENNYPNPFNPNTILEFSLPTGEWVNLAIYNILGQRVRVLIDEFRLPGEHSIIWNGINDNGEGVSSGIYFARLAAGKNVATLKMTLLK